MSQVIVKVLDLCKSALSKEVTKHGKVVDDCQAKENVEDIRHQEELNALHREYLIQYASVRSAHRTVMDGLFYRECQALAKKEVAQQYLNKLS